jgi:hypothetical protein
MRIYINTKRVKDSDKRGKYKSVRKRRKGSDMETRVVRIVSLGAIVSGAVACLSSIGIGLSLMLLATIVLAEV